MQDFDTLDKSEHTVVITGTSKGLGLACTKMMLEEQISVIGISRSMVQDESVLDNPKYKHIELDLLSHSYTEALSEAVGDRPISGLINNAGTGGDRNKLAEVDANEVSKLIQIHTLSSIKMTQTLLPNLLKTKNSRVLNISSRFGSLEYERTQKFNSARVSYSYRISKAAVNMLSLCMHSEVKHQNLILTAIHPGEIFTANDMPDASLTIEQAGALLKSCFFGIEPRHGGLFLRSDLSEMSY